MIKPMMLLRKTKY
uniref:Uncharacterized protein n=1 Tax=Rhizophora mucronata TaxID=61149 RepID=A0A2P2NLJ3_RHIMU